LFDGLDDELPLDDDEEFVDDDAFADEDVLVICALLLVEAPDDAIDASELAGALHPTKAKASESTRTRALMQVSIFFMMRL